MTTTEELLRDLWQEVLRVPVSGADANFFTLGGDSFRAARLAGLVTERLGVPASPSLPFDRPELGGQARWIERARREQADASDPANGPALTSTQEDFLIWMQESDPPRDPGSVCVAIRIEDGLDIPVLEDALALLTRRHEALRTVCVPTMRGLDVGTAEVLLPEVAVVSAGTETEALDLAAAERDRVADLVGGPLVRALVIRRTGWDVLVLSVHHFAFDGFSMGVLLRELGIAYSALRTGDPVPLRHLPLTYTDYCSWARSQWAVNQPYWDGTLAGAPKAIEPFPGRIPAKVFRRESHPFTISPDLVSALHKTAAGHAATSFMAVAACWAQVLADWTGQTDLILQSPVTGRVLPEHDSLIGCVVQTLLLRLDASGAPGFGELLDRTRATVLGAVDHQIHAFHETRRLVPYPSHLYYEPWGDGAHFPGLRSRPFEMPRDPEGLSWTAPDGEADLSAPTLTVSERGDGGFTCSIIYNRFGLEPAAARELAVLFTKAVARV